ncbi:MAG: Oxygen regulatory protein NreC [Gemmatimonadaceae bacterium]|nr:Oxygen regulatory protein NreC [Gemmatimonadaceae bacterium]
MTGQIRVLVVDDHAIVREGLRHVLSTDDDFVVVGEAGDGATALQLAEEMQPDVVLLDINLGAESGLDVARRLRARHETNRILILSVHDDREIVLESLRVGANGYVRKDTTPGELRGAIRAVFDGHAFFSASVAMRLTEALAERPTMESRTPDRSAGPTSAQLKQLTGREREVLVGVARGQMNKQIGAALGISVRTVESHRDSLMRKLQLRTTAALTRFAIDAGLLDEEAP